MCLKTPGCSSLSSDSEFLFQDHQVIQQLRIFFSLRLNIVMRCCFETAWLNSTILPWSNILLLDLNFHLIYNEWNGRQVTDRHERTASRVLFFMAWLGAVQHGEVLKQGECWLNGSFSLSLSLSLFVSLSFSISLLLLHTAHTFNISPAIAFLLKPDDSQLRGQMNSQSMPYPWVGFENNSRAL